MKLLFALSLLLAPLATLASEIKVAKLKGQVKWTNASIKQGESISGPGLLEVGKSDDSQVDLLYPDGHVLRLKSGSKLEMQGENMAAATTLKLLKGKLFAHFQKDKDAKKFELRTKTAVAGVRGTKFLLEESDKGAYVCVCEGEVEVKDLKGKVTRVVAKDYDLWAKPGQAIGTPKHSPDMGKMTADEFASMD